MRIHIIEMRKSILGILTASAILAIAAPIGTRQLLTVKTQQTQSGIESPSQVSESVVDQPVLRAPSFQGATDIRSAVNPNEKSLDVTFTPAPVRHAEAGDTYFNDFTDGGATMTIIDANNNNKTWQAKDGAMRCPYDGTMAMDDWMITPGIQLETGKGYELTIDAWVQSASYAEKIEVKIGKSATAADMTTTILPVTSLTNTEAQQIGALFSVSESGTYYIGIHAVSDKDTYYLYCDNLRISAPISGNTPAAVDDLTATPIGTDGKATIACHAPSKNIAGGNLTSLTKVEFWRGVTPIKTFENPTPGQALSFVDDCGAGTFEWKVVATNADGSSRATTVKATCTGPQGIPYLKTFPTATSLDDMTIIDANNDASTWGWDQYQHYARLSAPQTGDDDWLITPPLILKAGKVYEYQSLISAGNPTAFTPTVEVFIGNAATVAAMTQNIIPRTDITQYDTYFNKEFTVPADGLYYIGVHGCSSKYLALIKLMNINVIGGAEAEGPNKVTECTIEPDWSGRTQNVNISFKAPTTTGTGNPLTSITKIDIMRQGIVIKTFENPTPGQALQYTDPVGADGEFTYRIVGYNNVGQGSAVEQVVAIGVPGKSVPYLEDFKSADRWDNELTFIDNNNDGTPFWHASATDPCYAWVHYDGKSTSSTDDYLITPGITLEANTRYRISADAWGYNEGMELLVGSAPKIDSLTNKVVPLVSLGEELANYSGEFLAPYTGKYYVSVHAYTEAGKRVTDFHATNIRVERIGALNAPDRVQDFKVYADPQNMPKLTFKFKAPEKNMDGSTLTALTKIEIKRNGTVVKTFENPTPGAALEYTDEPGAEGEYTYLISPYSETGVGIETSYLGFAGLDLPATPQNIVATDMGNGNVKITWDPVTTNAHGAIISENPIYVILEVGNDGENQLGQVTQNEYTYKAYNTDEQKYFSYGIFPFNSASKQGQYGMSNGIFAGKPYTLSFLESFENGAPHSPYNIENLVFSSSWSLCTDETFSDLKSADGDNGFLGQQGYINCDSRFLFGKVTLEGAISPTLSFYVDNINPTDYTNEIIVDIKEVGTDNWTTIYNKPIKADVPQQGWGRISIDLAAYKGKEIQVGFRPVVKYTDDSHASYYRWTLMDGIRIHNLTNKDLGANIAVSSESVDAGEDIDITVTVSNNGEQAVTAYSVDLLKNGKVIDSLNGTNLASGRTEKLIFSQSVTVADPDEIGYSVRVNLEGDENPADNTSKVVNVKVNKPIYPAPANISAIERSNEGGTVDVTWGEPSMDALPPVPFTEDFESAQSWNNTSVNGWTFVDVDDAPVGGFEQFTFPGFTSGTTKSSFVVVDNTDNCFGQFATLFAGFNGSSKTIGSLLSWSGTPDDWAISPELYGGPQSVSFYAKNLQSNMPEKVELWYSTGSMDPNDFVFIKEWSLTSASWEKLSATLPNGAKRLAIRHHYQGGILQVDNVTFRRSGDQPETVTLKGYNVYRNGEKINESLITGNKFTETGVEQGDHTYAVNAIYDKGESNVVSTTLHTNTVIGVENNDAMVSGGNGIINVLNAGNNVTVITTLDGKVLYYGKPGDNLAFRTPAGIYIVKVGVKAVKVTVK